MIPHDLDAERFLLGDLFVWTTAHAPVMDTVDPSDFYAPFHAAVFDAMGRLYRSGERVDFLAVAELLTASGVVFERPKLVELTTFGTGGWRKAAEVVVRLSAARKLIALFDAGRKQIADGTDPAEVTETAKAELAAIDLPLVGGPPAYLSTLEDFVTSRPAELDAWLIPGLLREQWRAMIVAPEGKGKSWLFRQFAMLAAQGMHPLTYKPIPPVRCLLVDLENPADSIVRNCRPVLEAIRSGTVDYEPDRSWLWHRPQGIDLRARGDRGELERAVAATRPQLVCMGPLYKAYRVQARESDELAAGEVQQFLDRLRTRYGFALLLEHHAPKKQQGVRELTPYGSSLWMRWPELGIKLRPDDRAPKGSLLVETWRDAREVCVWPKRLDRGQKFPWVGVYDDAF